MRFFVTFLAILLTTTLTAQNIDLDLSDSVSVKSFISTHTICDQIEATIQNKYLVVESNNYGRLLLKSISLLSKQPLFIPIGSHGTIYSKLFRGANLEEQLREIKDTLNCFRQRQ